MAVGPEVLPGAEAFNIATETVKLSLESLNYFIAICLAVGGWALTSKTIYTTELFSFQRIALALAFVASAGGIARAIYIFQTKAGTALSLATEQAYGSSHQFKAHLTDLYAVPSEVTGPTLAGTMVLIIVIIFFSKPPTSANTEEKETSEG